MTPILLRKVKQPIQELQDLTLTLSDGSLPNQEILQKVGMEVKTRAQSKLGLSVIGANLEEKLESRARQSFYLGHHT